MVVNYRDKHFKDKYIVAICDFELQETLLKISSEEYTIISTYGLKEVLETDLTVFIQYELASVVIDLSSDAVHIHQETRGCPNDYCDDVKDINIGIAKGEFCKECRRKLLTANEKGKLTLPAFAATYKILDYVTKRKICFVIMPFRTKFDDVYKGIKKAVKKMDYECVRADEIFDARSFMAIVSEMIERSEVIIADLTDRNPNVFYEVGYAHAFGKNTILITQNTDDVPADLRHRQYFRYELNSRLQTTIEANLKRYLQ